MIFHCWCRSSNRTMTRGFSSILFRSIKLVALYRGFKGLFATRRELLLQFNIIRWLLSLELLDFLAAFNALHQLTIDLIAAFPCTALHDFFDANEIKSCIYGWRQGREKSTSSLSFCFGLLNGATEVLESLSLLFLVTKIRYQMSESF